MQYYRPYIDSLGEKFYLPKEWRQGESLSGRGKSKVKKGPTTHWQESKINYSFDDEINGIQLIRNLHWLGRTNNLLEMNVSDEEEEEDNDNEDDVRKKPNLYSSGVRKTNNEQHNGQM